MNSGSVGDGAQELRIWNFWGSWDVSRVSAGVCSVRGLQESSIYTFLGPFPLANQGASRLLTNLPSAY